MFAGIVAFAVEIKSREGMAKVKTNLETESHSLCDKYLSRATKKPANAIANIGNMVSKTAIYSVLLFFIGLLKPAEKETLALCWELNFITATR